MIKNNNNVVLKIYYNGKEIQKVFQNKIQIFPEVIISGDMFWIQVLDNSDNTTYFYLCERTSVVYDSEDSSKIIEIHYKATTKQAVQPSDNKQIYQLHDDVITSGEDYQPDDFANFVGKSEDEVLGMTQTYQEKLIDVTNSIPGLMKLDDVYSENGVITYTEVKKSDVDTSKFTQVASIPDNYTFCYSDYTQDKDYKLYQIIFQNTSGYPQNFYFITAGEYPDYTYALTYTTDNLEDFEQYKNTSNTEFMIGKSGWIDNKGKDRGVLYTATVLNNQFISFYIALRVKSSGETFYNIFAYNSLTFSLVNGNILTHKYISDEIKIKIKDKIQYNYSLALVKNDLSNVVYTTNCKYIRSKKEAKAVESYYSLWIHSSAPGWKLLDRDEWVKYRPYNTDYKMTLTVSKVKSTGNQFWGLLDKSDDTKDFRIFGYSSKDIYIDPGSLRTSVTLTNNYSLVTIVLDGKNNQYEVWQENKQLTSWVNRNSGGGAMNNDTTLYLNAYTSESTQTTESFYFYEFKIEDKDGNIVKRIVPSDILGKLYECVSNTYINPCRDASSISMTLSKNNVDLTYNDGCGNPIEHYYIYSES